MRCESAQRILRAIRARPKLDEAIEHMRECKTCQQVVADNSPDDTYSIVLIAHPPIAPGQI